MSKILRLEPAFRLDDYQVRTGEGRINLIHPYVTDTKSHAYIQQQYTTQLVVVMEGPRGVMWKADLCEEQIVALRPDDICHETAGPATLGSVGQGGPPRPV